METINLEYQDPFDENKTKELVFSKHLIKSDFKKESLFALIVDGKSMEPLIKDRAVVVADLSQKELLNNDIYLLYYENSLWVKKYDEKIDSFVSINKKFSHLVYEKSSVHLVAKVILTFTNL